MSRNSNIFIQENALENVACEMAPILSWPWCIKVTLIASVRFLVADAISIAARSARVNSGWSNTWWHHQMKTFSLTLCEGNPLVTGGFPSHRPVTRSFDVFFLKIWWGPWEILLEGPMDSAIATLQNFLQTLQILMLWVPNHANFLNFLTIALA